MPEQKNLTDFRILVVDDQTANLEALALVLELAGYTSVRCLDDSRQAVEVFREFQPDLILLDITIPGAASHEVLAQALQVRQT